MDIVYVVLKSPSSVSSKAVKAKIESFIDKGYKTNQILWKMDFITTDAVVKKVSDEFQKLKNKISFNKK